MWVWHGCGLPYLTKLMPQQGRHGGALANKDESHSCDVHPMVGSRLIVFTRQRQDRLLFATSRDWWMGNRNYYGRTPCVYHLCTWCHHTWPDLPGPLHSCIQQVFKDWRWEWPGNKSSRVPASKHGAYWIEWPPFGVRIKVHTLKYPKPLFLCPETNKRAH